jgi:hypothetical protein
VSVFYRNLSVSLWTRRLATALTAALAVAATVALPVSAAAPDTEGPTILSAWVSHDTIDVVDGPVQVTVRLVIQDLGSGLAAGYPRLDPGPEYATIHDAIPGKAMTRVSGDSFKGTYEATFTFPEFIRSGPYTFDPSIVDVAGNHYLPSNGDVSNTIGIIPVVVSNTDKDAPTVTTSLSTKVVDITDGPGNVTVAANAYDSGIGFPLTTRVRVNGRETLNSSTDPHRAIFRNKIEFPRYTAASDSRGKFRFTFRGIADANDNANDYVVSEELIVATRPLRGKRSDLSVAAGSVSATWAANEDQIGVLPVLEYEVEFAGQGLVRAVRITDKQASVNDLPAGTYTGRVRARNQLGWGEWTTSSAPVVYTLAPMKTSAPVISGTTRVGQTLTVNPGTWTEGSTLSYRWLAGGVEIPGGSNSTIVLSPEHAGKAISVRVTGSKAGYVTTSKFSSLTAFVSNGLLVGGAPTITGTPRVGSILTARPGSWSPAPVTLSYQWYSSGAAVTGATSATYKLAAADLGKAITVKTTARKVGYSVASKTSRPTAPVANNVLTAPRPSITGTAAVGRTLTAKAGTWSPAGVTLAYQWNRNGSPIPGATASSYKAVLADLGSVLSVRVTGRKSGYLVKAATSNSTARVTK